MVYSDGNILDRTVHYWMSTHDYCRCGGNLVLHTVSKQRGQNRFFVLVVKQKTSILHAIFLIFRNLETKRTSNHQLWSALEIWSDSIWEPLHWVHYWSQLYKWFELFCVFRMWVTIFVIILSDRWICCQILLLLL